MTLSAYFLDTNVLVTAFLFNKSDARRLLESARKGNVRLLTSEYVLKELRFTLVKKMRAPREVGKSFILDVLGPNVLMLKKPFRHEVKAFAYELSDRSDIPIILPCVKHGLTLVTLDIRLARSARNLIEVRSAREAVKEIAVKERPDVEISLAEFKRSRRELSKRAET